MAQAVDGYSTGKYYFELVNPTGDIFSAWWGGGVGANFASGGDYNRWMVGAGFNSGNNLGGAQISGQNLSHELSSLYATGSNVVPDVFNFATNAGNVVGVAVFLTGPVPPTHTATLAELWFGQTAGFVDLTSVAARRNFISLTGGAQNLGLDGSAPFGVAPPVYLSRRGIPATFAANNGRGGAFAISGGTLTAAGLDPPGSGTSSTTVLPGSPGQGASNPQLVLRWSDDGGKTWSHERFKPAGKLGQTAFTVKFDRLGSTQRFGGSDRIFELSSTDPFKVAILDSDLEVS